jgi:hypothetical protein
MSLTLTEGELYSTTEMQRAVIDRLVKDSDVLKQLGFTTILGNSLTYDTITTDSGASFYSVGDSWVESTPSITQATATLKVLGGDADVDNFLLKTRSNKIDLQGTVLANKVKAVQYKFLDSFYYGTTLDADSFSGLHQLMTSTTYNTVHAGSTTGSVLSCIKAREAKDLITGWKPSLLIMGKEIRRKLSVYLDSVGSAFPRGVDRFGTMVEMFDGVPIAVDDHILNTETAASGAFAAATGGGNTTLFFVTFDDMAACGIHSGDGVQVEPLGSLETKDASRWRIKWYVSMMLQDLRSCSKVDGVDSDGTVTA